jgi:hypothetical protein
MTHQHDMVRTLMTFDDELDDIKRARIWLQLEDKLADEIAVPRRRRWPLATLAGAALAAAVVAIVVRMPRDRADHTLAVPAGTTVTSQIGPHTRAALVGPAQLELVGTPSDAATIRIRSGTFLADFTGGPGRSLRIETHAAVVEVVGTLFAVEVRGTITCTSVAHGRVRVTTDAAVRYVAAGERFCTSDAAVQPIDASIKDALVRHEAVITATANAPAANAPAANAPASHPAASIPSNPAANPATANPAAANAPTANATASNPPTAYAPNRAAAKSAASKSATSKSATSKSAASKPAASNPETHVASPSTPASSDAASTPKPAVSNASTTSNAASTSTAMPSPPPPTTAAPTPPPAPRATADELYRRAEQALAARDPKTADRVLATLVAEYPSSPLVDQAHYDRARIAYQQRAWNAARGHLDRLAGISDTRLAEPGHYLRCRIAVEAKSDAAACFIQYRTRFPRAPHDLEALGVIAQHTYAQGGCARAAAVVGELARAHPRTTLAAAWRTRCPEESQ